MGKTIDISETTNPFLDTNNEAVIKAYTKGFIKGTSENIFSGDEVVKREEIVAMIVRMYQTIETELGKDLLADYDQETVFTDNSEISDWAIEGINLAYYNGIIVGYDDGYFYPKSNVTKEEAIIINYRAYRNIMGKIVETSEVASEESAPIQKGYVTCSVLNIRNTPDSSSNDYVIGQLNRYANVEIQDQIDDWYEVVTDDNINGYVHSDYIKVIEDSSESVEADTIRAEVVDYAQKFVGLAYVYGGNSLKTGTDCSGFVQLILKEFGYDINRTATAQTANGIYVDQSDLLPGDLVFYGRNGNIEHVAMYIGDGKVIHEGNQSTGVLINDVFSSWNKPFVTIRRIIY
jgi:cell wall-associated NlpC family hydrolase